MFKEENQVFLYLVGILISFGILIVTAQNISLSKILTIGKIFNDPEDIFANSPAITIDQNLNYLATVTTNLGTFTIDLFEKNAPTNVNNFVHLANNNYYVNTLFHRLVPNVLVQGGDRNTLNTEPTDDGQGRAGYVLKGEVNLDSLPLSQEEKDKLIGEGYESTASLTTPAAKQYMVFMANDGYDTNSTQFFIVLADSSSQIIQFFNGRFTPIGLITSGIQTLQNINNVPVDDPESNFAKPTQNIVLQNIVIQTL